MCVSFGLEAERGNHLGARPEQAVIGIDKLNLLQQMDA